MHNNVNECCEWYNIHYKLDVAMTGKNDILH